MHNAKNAKTRDFKGCNSLWRSTLEKIGKWSAENRDRKTNEEVEKLYNIYMQRQIELKDQMTDRAMGRHLINLYSNGVRKVLNIYDKDQLRKDIDEHRISKDSMAIIGILMVSNFGKCLSPVLVACDTRKPYRKFWNR